MMERTSAPRRAVAIFLHLTLKTEGPSLMAVRGGWGFDMRMEQQVEEGVEEVEDELHEEPMADSL